MDDYISRQQAVDAFNTNLNELVVGGEENAKAVENYLSGVFDRLNSLPPTQPEPHWIPVTERLPEDVEEGQKYPTVIYSTNSGEVAAGWYEILTRTWWRESISDDVIKDKVIAWMPLPEPFKGGDGMSRVKDMEEVIEGLPSAEPERPRGRWIPVDSYSAFGGDEATWMAHGNPVAFYYCSECKGQAYAGEDGESLLTDYCPNCGADMRGE